MNIFGFNMITNYLSATRTQNGNRNTSISLEETRLSSGSVQEIISQFNSKSPSSEEGNSTLNPLSQEFSGVSVRDRIEMINKKSRESSLKPSPKDTITTQKRNSAEEIVVTTSSNGSSGESDSPTLELLDINSDRGASEENTNATIMDPKIEKKASNCFSSFRLLLNW